MDFGSRASIELVFTDVDFCHDFGSDSEHGYFFEKWSIQLVDAMVLWNMYVVIIDGVLTLYPKDGANSTPSTLVRGH